jgi:hypothetical protein
VSSGFAALGESACDTTYLADIENDFDAQVDLATPGAAPLIVFDAYVPGSTTKILQTYSLQITLPPAFGWSGFGAAGASVGQLDFNFGNDHDFDQSDYTIPHRAIDANTAYADSLANGVYDAGVDAVATHQLGPGSAGIVQLPATPGSYDMEIDALSVDPDTGDATDNAGLPPISYARTFPIQVPEPAPLLAAIAAMASLAALRGRRD